MLRAVIFDFDGVIVDSELLHFRAFNLVTQQFGIEISKKSYFEDCLGLNDREVFQMLVDNNNLTEYKNRANDLVEQKTILFKELAESEGQIIPGVKEFINMLAENNIPMAICSGALEAEIIQILNAAKMNDFFKTIIAADHVTRGKPDPQGFLLALAQLNIILNTDIAPSESIVIEDSRWGLVAAKAAEMHPVAVTNTYPADMLEIAELITDDLSSLNVAQLSSLCS